MSHLLDLYVNAVGTGDIFQLEEIVVFFTFQYSKNFVHSSNNCPFLSTGIQDNYENLKKNPNVTVGCLHKTGKFIMEIVLEL